MSINGPGLPEVEWNASMDRSGFCGLQMLLQACHTHGGPVTADGHQQTKNRGQSGVKRNRTEMGGSRVGGERETRAGGIFTKSTQLCLLGVKVIRVSMSHGTRSAIDIHEGLRDMKAL